jgi:hypothetical protein
MQHHHIARHKHCRSRSAQVCVSPLAHIASPPIVTSLLQLCIIGTICCAQVGAYGFHSKLNHGIKKQNTLKEAKCVFFRLFSAPQKQKKNYVHVFRTP